MPVYNDISENKVLGPAHREGEPTVIRRMIAKRFGPMPAWAEERPAALSATELEALSGRLLDAQSIEDLLTWRTGFPSVCVFGTQAWDKQRRRRSASNIFINAEARLANAVSAGVRRCASRIRRSRVSSLNNEPHCPIHQCRADLRLYGG
jgi:hypothetical protein